MLPISCKGVCFWSGCFFLIVGIIEVLFSFASFLLKVFNCVATHFNVAKTGCPTSEMVLQRTKGCPCFILWSYFI